MELCDDHFSKPDCGAIAVRIAASGASAKLEICHSVGGKSEMFGELENGHTRKLVVAKSIRHVLLVHRLDVLVVVDPGRECLVFVCIVDKLDLVGNNPVPKPVLEYPGQMCCGSHR